MIRSPDFLLREVAGSKVAVPVGAAARKFPGILNLNETGCYLWELLEQERTLDELVDAVTQRYEVTRQQAREDTEEFIKRMRAVEAVH